MNSNDYLSQILGLTGSGTINNNNGFNQLITNNGNGSYSYGSDLQRLNANDLNSLLNGNLDASSIFMHNPSAQNQQVFGVGDPNMQGTNRPLTYADVMSHPDMIFGGGPGGDGGFGTPSSKQLGNNTPGLIRSLGAAGTAIMGGILGGAALGPELAGVDAAGNAFTGGLGLSATAAGGLSGAGVGAEEANVEGRNVLSGALQGGIGGAIGANFSPMNALSDAFPETMGSINPFSSSNDVSASDINWNPDAAQGPNLPTNSGSGFSSGGMSVSGGVSSPASAGASPSSAPSFGPSSFTSSPSLLASPSPLVSSDPLSSLSGPSVIPNPSGANISGGAQPSIFDNLANGNVSQAASGVGNFVQNNPFTTLGAGAAIAGGLSQAGVFNSPSNDANVNSTFTPTPFNPSEQSPMAAPSSLSQYSGLNPFQQATNLATQGVYGSGNGPQENSYFLNLINRQLYDNGGNLASNNNSINPIENSYLSQLGITGQNPTDILKGISQYGT